MDLSDIKGLGPAKQDALRNAGIVRVEDLAAIDLRKNVDVQGISQEALKGLKQRARKLLAAEGEPVPKTVYRGNGKGRASAKRAESSKPAAPAEPVVGFREKPVPERPGFLRRLLTRRHYSLRGASTRQGYHPTPGSQSLTLRGSTSSGQALGRQQLAVPSRRCRRIIRGCRSIGGYP
jgi:hypothetical protein